MTKRIIGIVAVFLVGTLVLALWPRPLTFDRICTGLKRDGFNVANIEHIKAPGYGAKEEYRMTINGAVAQVFEFQERDKFEACYQLYRDPVRTRRELVRLGISPTGAGPTLVERNEWFILTITTHDEALRNRVIYVFNNL